MTWSERGSGRTGATASARLGRALAVVGLVGSFAPGVALADPLAFITNWGLDSGTATPLPGELENDDVSVFNVGSRALVALVEVENKPYGVAFTPDGNRVYVANSHSDSVTVINSDQSSPGFLDTTSIPLEAGTLPYGVVANPLRPEVYVANRRSTPGDPNPADVAVINTIDHSVSYITIGSPAPVPKGLAVAPDGRYLFVANWGTHDVRVVDLDHDTVTATIALTGSKPRAIVISPDGTVGYVSTYTSGYVSVIDTDPHSPTSFREVDTLLPTAPPVCPNRVIGFGHGTRGMALTSDGTGLYVANYFSNSVTLFDTTTPAYTNETICVGNGPTGLSITPDDDEVWVTMSRVIEDTDTLYILNDDRPKPTVIQTMDAEGAGTPTAFGAFIGPH